MPTRVVRLDLSSPTTHAGRAFDHGRLAQKMKYGGEFLPNVRESASGLLFQEFFLRDKTRGGAKGIVELDLRSFSP